MGRYYWDKKQEADGLKNVSISFLRKHGYLVEGWRTGRLTWSRHGEETGNISIQSSINEHEQYVRFIYSQTNRDTDEKTEYDYKGSRP